MAKDLNTPNLSVVAEDGSLKVVSVDGATEAKLGAVYLDGERLEGVYSEVWPGQLQAVCGVDAVDEVQVPKGLAQRDALLKKWSDSAVNAGRAKKAGGATLMLLTLAACGGGGGGGGGIAVSAPTAGSNPKDAAFSDGDNGGTIDVSSSSTGATVKINDLDPSNNNTGTAKINGTGSSGELILKFDDADDTLIVDGKSDISGFTTITVIDGTVDFTALASNVTTLQNATLKIGSGAVLTYSQFAALKAVELRDGAAVGDLIITMDVSQALDGATSDAIERIIKDQAIKDGLVTRLSQAESVTLDVADADTLLDRLSDTTGLTLTIEDTAANILGAEAADIAAAGAVALSQAESVTLDVADADTLLGRLSDTTGLTLTVQDSAGNLDGVATTAVTSANTVIATAGTADLTGLDLSAVDTIEIASGETATVTVAQAAKVSGAGTYNIVDTAANVQVEFDQNGNAAGTVLGEVGTIDIVDGVDGILAAGASSNALLSANTVTVDGSVNAQQADQLNAFVDNGIVNGGYVVKDTRANIDASTFITSGGTVLGPLANAGSVEFVDASGDPVVATFSVADAAAFLNAGITFVNGYSIADTSSAINAAGQSVIDDAASVSLSAPETFSGTIADVKGFADRLTDTTGLTLDITDASATIQAEVDASGTGTGSLLAKATSIDTNDNVALQLTIAQVADIASVLSDGYAIRDTSDTIRDAAQSVVNTATSVALVAPEVVNYTVADALTITARLTDPTGLTLNLLDDANVIRDAA